MSARVSTTVNDTRATFVEEFEKTFELTNVASALVSVSNVSGPISIEAWDQAHVHIHAVKSSNSRRAFERTRIEFTQDGNQITARTLVDNQFESARLLDFLRGGDAVANVEYIVKMPAASAAQAHDINGHIGITGLSNRIKATTINGALFLKEINGATNASTTNGKLMAENISGSAELSAVNGSLEFQDAELQRLDASTVSGNLRGKLIIQPEGAYSFRTTNGGCELLLPPDSRCTVRMKAVNGTVECELPFAEILSERKPGARRWEAAINGGGAKIDFSTVNGNLHLRATDARGNEQTSSPSSGEGHTMEILRAVERGELTVDEALKQL